MATQSVNRYQNHGSSDAEAGRATCPSCGHSFACGGTVKKAEGGEIEPTAWRKRDVELPRHELDTYRGEGVPRGEDRSVEDDEEDRRLAYAREIRRKRGY
jgi:hypothetical protein